jgi:hypothetical protein
MSFAETDLKARFEKIYADDKWTYGSGPGSLESINKPYIEFLESFIQNNKVDKIIDIGCGDFQFMRRVDMGQASYLGFDVATSIVKVNQTKFGNDRLKFCEMPDDFSQIPDCDIFILKDIMIHLDNKYCQKLINCIKSKSKYAIFVNNCTNIIEDYNKDINSGDFRPVDVSLAPFNLHSAVVLRYSNEILPDPRYPKLISRIMRKYIWPGRKHVQLSIFI